MKKIAMFSVLSLALVFAGCLDNDGTGNFTPQPTAAVQPAVFISVVDYPMNVGLGQNIVVKWRVDSSSAAFTNHTSVHYGPQPILGNVNANSYPSLTPVQQGSLPGEFSATIPASFAGSLYFRAHIIVGGRDYWTDEKSITVTQPASTPTPASSGNSSAMQEINVTAMKFEFIPGTNTPITVKKGVPVKLHIFVPANDTAHGFSVPALGINANLSVGQTTTVEFIPASAGTFPFLCSVYCGSGHMQMKGTLVVTD